MRSCLLCNKGVYPVCPICKSELIKGRTYYEIPYVDRLDTIFSYSSGLKSYMLKTKFGRKYSLIPVFCDIIIEEHDFEKYDFITYIPSDIKRLYKRGFNVSRELAKGLSKRTGIPFKQLLGKSYPTKESHGLDFLERSQLQHSFYSKVNQFYGRVLLVDDIITSGSTISEAARVLKFSNDDLSVDGLVFLDNKGEE